jgi:hypothetical protein
MRRLLFPVSNGELRLRVPPLWRISYMTPMTVEKHHTEVAVTV